MEEGPRPEGGVGAEVLRLRLSSLGGARMRWSPPRDSWALVEDRVTQPPEAVPPLLLTWVEQERSVLKTEDW